MPKVTKRKSGARRKTKSANMMGAVQLGPTRTRRRSAKRGWRSKLGDLRRSAYRYRPFAIVVGLFLATASIYGLSEGGHFARLSSFVDAQTRSFLVSSGFGVESITVSGRGMARADELLAATGVERGNSILHVQCGEVRRRVEALGWVESASVTRLLPNRIHIEIDERIPLALWQSEGQILLIDGTGSQITSNNLEQFSQLPLVVGRGADLNSSSLIKALAEFPLIASRMHAAVRVGDRRWNLRLDNGIDIKLPESDIEASLRRLTKLEERTRILMRDIRVIDMRLPDRLIVQIAEDAMTADNQPGKDT
jgi:cell division protein FtsQ